MIKVALQRICHQLKHLRELSDFIIPFIIQMYLHISVSKLL